HLSASPLSHRFLEQTLLVELISFPRHHLPPSPGAVADDRLHTAASDAVIGHGLLGALHWTERRVIFVSACRPHRNQRLICYPDPRSLIAAHPLVRIAHGEPDGGRDVVVQLEWRLQVAYLLD